MSFLLTCVPWYVRVIAVAFVLIAAVAWGFTKGVGYKQAQWDEFNRVVANERVNEVARFAAFAKDAQEKISAERQKRADDGRKFREKLRHASHLTTCTVNVSRLTGEFIGLYNDGLFQGLPGPANSPGANGAGNDADSVGADEVLDNHAINAESCNKARSQVTAWQQLARKNKWVK